MKKKARIVIAGCAALALALPASSMAQTDLHATCTALGLGSEQELDLGPIGYVSLETCSRLEGPPCEPDEYQILVPGVIRTTITICWPEEV